MKLISIVLLLNVSGCMKVTTAEKVAPIYQWVGEVPSTYCTSPIKVYYLPIKFVEGGGGMWLFEDCRGFTVVR